MQIKGNIPALITPMFSGEIDYDSAERHLSWLLQEGVHGVLVNGTTGENPTLSWAEQKAFIRYVVERIASRVPVIAGVGGNDTLSVLERANEAQSLGIDAILSVAPYYNKPSQAGILAHYQALHAVLRIPLILYNVPGRTGVNIASHTTLSLAQLPRVVAIKEASGDLVQVQEILREAPEGFQVICGEDALLYPMLCLGASAVQSVASNVIPRHVTAIFSHIWKGQMAEACRLHLQALPLVKGLFYENSPASSKWLLKEMGLIRSAELRLPLVELSEAAVSQMRHAVQESQLPRMVEPS